MGVDLNEIGPVFFSGCPPPCRSGHFQFSAPFYCRGPTCPVVVDFRDPWDSSFPKPTLFLFGDFSQSFFMFSYSHNCSFFSYKFVVVPDGGVFNGEAALLLCMTPACVERLFLLPLSVSNGGVHNGGMLVV